MNEHVQKESADRLELANKISSVRAEFNNLLRHIDQWHKLEKTVETEYKVSDLILKTVKNYSYLKFYLKITLTIH